ncbi:MAG: baseplate J/gp47 family protein [Eubacterium sp.]|nr:baseplate J/gp47 family protein [Eubacterium sp.]
MFENRTYENILDEMLSAVGSGFDKREGSIIYDALAPAALEAAQIYADLEAVLNQVFADTADREYLIRRAIERGLEPYEASKSRVKGEFNIDVGVGSRFSLGSVNFITLEYTGLSDEGYFVYSLECETAGSEGNVTGDLIPIDNISGLSYACAVEILVYGDDEEDTEEFRQRYFDSINNIAFGGNIADYKAKVGAMDGVGGVKVYRADDWLGAGTVKIVITDTENGTPTEELITYVKETLDPSDREGEGVGLAPIGHIVSVYGAEVQTVDISCEVTSDGTNADLEADAKQAILDYITGLNEEWEDKDSIVLYISHIIAELVDVEGVVDVVSVTINGASENLTLGEDCIAALGEFSLKEG